MPDRPGYPARMRVGLAVVALALALGIAVPGASAANTARWTTERAVVRIAETSGLTLNDASHIRPVDGFCAGEGPHRGTYTHPTFTRFRCTLVTVSRYGTSTWYSLRVFPLAGLTWAVVLDRY